jgi:hypothetical protein
VKEAANYPLLSFVMMNLKVYLNFSVYILLKKIGYNGQVRKHYGKPLNGNIIPIFIVM